MHEGVLSKRRKEPRRQESLPRTRFGDKLSTELWVMVSEHLFHLQAGELHDLRNLRLVSRRFSQIATPYYYRRFIIRPHHLVRRPGELGRRVLSRVKVFTMTIITDQDVPTTPGRLLEILTQCAQLQTLEYGLHLSPNRSASFPAEIKNALASPLSRLRLHINVCKRQFVLRYDLSVKSIAITSSNLVYLDLSSHVISQMAPGRLNEVRDLLVRSTRLETLCIKGSDLFETWQPHHGSMPPIKELRLTRWWGTPGHILDTDIWNISKLKTLSSKDEIVSLSHRAFMQSFPPHSITGLRSFEYNPISGNQPQSLTAVENHKEANKCLVQMIEDNQEIEELLITAHFTPELIPSITLRLGQTLKVLRLRSPDFQDPETSLEDVVALRITCSVLTSLEISISFPDRAELAHEDLSHPTFIIVAELSKISSLQRLKLISQSPAYTVDRDPRIQKIIIDIARGNKVGASLSQLTFLFPHYKRVDLRYESCQVDYSWDFLGTDLQENSRDWQRRVLPSRFQMVNERDLSTTPVLSESRLKMVHHLPTSISLSFPDQVSSRLKAKQHHICR